MVAFSSIFRAILQQKNNVRGRRHEPQGLNFATVNTWTWHTEGGTIHCAYNTWLGTKHERILPPCGIKPQHKLNFDGVPTAARRENCKVMCVLENKFTDRLTNSCGHCSATFLHRSWTWQWAWWKEAPGSQCMKMFRNLAQRHAPELSTPPFCSIFCIDHENDNEAAWKKL